MLQRPKPPELRPCPVRRDPDTPHQIPVKNGRAAQPAALHISARRVPALQQLDWSPAVLQIERYCSTLPPYRLPDSSCLPAGPQVQPPFLQNHPQLRPPFPLGTCKQIYALPPLSLPSSAIYLPDCLCLLLVCAYKTEHISWSLYSLLIMLTIFWMPKLSIGNIKN